MKYNSVPRVSAFKNPKELIITTDGGCVPNPGRGGWAAIIRDGESVVEISGSSHGKSTNNRMEFQAVIEALQYVMEPRRILVRTDSTILCNLLNGRGMSPSKRQNQDLVLRILELKKRHELRAVWVKGHNGDADNELADRLASMQISGRQAPKVAQPSTHRPPAPAPAAVILNPVELVVTTEGRCHPNPGQGGWAAVIRDGANVLEISGRSDGISTNARMELQAVIEVLESLVDSRRILVRTNCTILSGFLNATGKDFSQRQNQDLIGRVVELRMKHDLRAEWVRYHEGDSDNRRADQLAASKIKAA